MVDAGRGRSRLPVGPKARGRRVPTSTPPIAPLAVACADQNDPDYQPSLAAIRSGRLRAERGRCSGRLNRVRRPGSVGN